MAKATLTVRFADIERTRLLLWELRVLADDMRVAASPHAERLEAALDRYTDGGDDDRPEDDPNEPHEAPTL